MNQAFIWPVPRRYLSSSWWWDMWNPFFGFSLNDLRRIVLKWRWLVKCRTVSRRSIETHSSNDISKDRQGMLISCFFDGSRWHTNPYRSKGLDQRIFHEKYATVIGFGRPKVDKLGQGSFGACDKVTWVVDGVVSKAFRAFLCEVVFDDLPLEALRFEDEDSYRIAGAAGVLFTTVSEGALLPILGLGYQMRYLIDWLLLLIIEGT